MAKSNFPSSRVPRRRLPLTEKRRIVELSLRAGASVRAIAREHGVNRNSLYQWQALYRAGKLGTHSASSNDATPQGALLPVRISPVTRAPKSGAGGSAEGSVMQIMFACGATLQLEVAALESDLLRTVLAVRASGLPLAPPTCAKGSPV